MVTVDEQLRKLMENHGSLTKCGTTRDTIGLSIDQQTVLVNHHFVKRRFLYLILEDSKYGAIEEYRRRVNGYMDRSVGPLFDSERVQSGEEK